MDTRKLRHIFRDDNVKNGKNLNTDTLRRGTSHRVGRTVMDLKRLPSLMRSLWVRENVLQTVPTGVDRIRPPLSPC